ncbi:MAG: zinc ribbon domain-containing protein [Firmicutes bacterium]|nr:zinc ribbon domain-containing protein [Bacillota bacterium]
MKICQSCSMPLTKPQDYGTNLDKSVSDDYCVHCLCDGKFLAYQTVEDAIADSVNYAEYANMTKEQMLAYAKENYPKLKRWAK